MLRADDSTEVQTTTTSIGGTCGAPGPTASRAAAEGRRHTGPGRKALGGAVECGGAREARPSDCRRGRRCSPAARARRASASPSHPPAEANDVGARGVVRTRPAFFYGRDRHRFRVAFQHWPCGQRSPPRSGYTPTRPNATRQRTPRLRDRLRGQRCCGTDDARSHVIPEALPRLTSAGCANCSGTPSSCISRSTSRRFTCRPARRTGSSSRPATGQPRYWPTRSASAARTSTTPGWTSSRLPRHAPLCMERAGLSTDAGARQFASTFSGDGCSAVARPAATGGRGERAFGRPFAVSASSAVRDRGTGRRPSHPDLAAVSAVGVKETAGRGVA